jgi:hypothetical protein
VSDAGLRSLRTCAIAMPIAALLAPIGLGATDGGTQSGGNYCDAAYCYVQTCERRPAPAATCRYVIERVCRPVVKQERTTHNVKRCHTVTDQTCDDRSVNECKSVNQWVCKPTHDEIAEAEEEATEVTQRVGYLTPRKVRRRLRTVRRPYYSHRQATPQRQQRKPYKWVGRPNRPYPPYQKSGRDRRADKQVPTRSAADRPTA